MPIASIPLDPIVLRSVRLACEHDTRRSTGIRVTDSWRTPIRDASGRFVPFSWFGDK